MCQLCATWRTDDPSANMCSSLTARANPRVRFARAIGKRNVVLAELAMGEMENVLLEDALSLVWLYAEVGDRRYEVAARKYLGRWILEEKPSLTDITILAGMLAERA